MFVNVVVEIWVGIVGGVLIMTSKINNELLKQIKVSLKQISEGKYIIFGCPKKDKCNEVKQAREKMLKRFKFEVGKIKSNAIGSLIVGKKDNMSVAETIIRLEQILERFGDEEKRILDFVDKNEKESIESQKKFKKASESMEKGM